MSIVNTIFLHRYSQQAKQLSSLYHDRPLSPGAELVYWVEHVSRTGGALHLRSLALPLSLYQKLYLDWIALIFTSIVIFVCFVKYFVSNIVFNKQKLKTN